MNEKPSSSPSSDHQWMTAYLQDDPEAFGHIYGAYSDAVYGYLTKRVSESSERDDLFQKIWMKFHRSRSQWSSEYPLLQWLFVISRSVILDRYRETKRSPHGHLSPDEFALGNVSAEESAPVRDAADAEEQKELEAEMLKRGLSADQIRVIREHLFEEEDYEAIAARLGKSAVSVRKIFSRGIERLKKTDLLRTRKRGLS